MQFGHTVDTVAAYYCQTCHMHLVIPEDRHIPGNVIPAGESLTDGFQPAPVDFIHDQENTGQQFFEHRDRPAFQCFRHNRMIGVSH